MRKLYLANGSFYAQCFLFIESFLPLLIVSMIRPFLEDFLSALLSIFLGYAASSSFSTPSPLSPAVLINGLFWNLEILNEFHRSHSFSYHRRHRLILDFRTLIRATRWKTRNNYISSFQIHCQIKTVFIIVVLRIRAWFPPIRVMFTFCVWFRRAVHHIYLLCIGHISHSWWFSITNSISEFKFFAFGFWKHRGTQFSDELPEFGSYTNPVTYCFFITQRLLGLTLKKL